MKRDKYRKQHKVRYVYEAHRVRQPEVKKKQKTEASFNDITIL